MMSELTYETVRDWVISDPSKDGIMSVSTIKRRFRIAHGRAEAFMRRLIEDGIVSAVGKPRTILKTNK
ncbi:DNA translocase FtsK [Bacillus halotolerans]|uniref:DNA translocase FtsK n=1 Tax=Bacillus halotolerans TaxID=260554 RepID=UPI003F6CD80D